MLSFELWLGFALAIALLIVLDLALFTRRLQIVSRGEAIASFALWVLASYAVALGVYAIYEENWLNLHRAIETGITPITGAGKLTGFEAHFQFLAVYVTEVGLSLDNIAVLALLFAYFKVPARAMPRALLWSGVIALVVRLVLTLAGATMLNSAGLTWTSWIFTGLLIIALLRLLFMPDEPSDFSRSKLAARIRRLLPVADDFDGHRLTTRRTPTGKRAFTPLFVAVLVAAWIDLTYTADSIPAAFALTRDPFIAFAASALAILSLRSLFFSLGALIGRLRYLKPAVVLILAALIVKNFFFIAHPGALPPEWMTLGTSVLLLVAVGMSLLYLRRTDPAALMAPRPSAIADLEEAARATRRNFRKVLILIAGTIVIMLGIAIAPLPGPGPTVIVPIGIAILATEFAWARTLLVKMKDAVLAVDNFSTRLSRAIPPWAVFPIVLAYVGFFYVLSTLNPENWGWINFLGISKDGWFYFILMTSVGLAFPFCAFMYRLATGRRREVKPPAAREEPPSP